MAADCKDVELEMSINSPVEQVATPPGPVGAGDADARQDDSPDAPATVPTVSENVAAAAAGGAGGPRVRVPRRVLHFSDGTLEEYSTEEEDETDQPPDTLAQLRRTDTKSLGWVPWAWYWFRLAGHSTLSGVDNVGEKLAYMLGITSPKYQYELDEYYDMKRREEEEQQQRDLESAGWTPGSALTNTATNPAAYLVDPAQRPVTAPPGQSEPVTALPGQSAAADQLADQSAASARLISDQSAPEASGVSSLPVAAVTVP